MKLIKDNLLKVTLFTIILGVIFLMISNGKYVLFPQENKNTDQEFKYQTEQFADIKRQVKVENQIDAEEDV